MTITVDVLAGINIPNMTRWVERLERNEDPQTKGALQRIAVGNAGEPIGFCCLGIACDEALKEGAVTAYQPAIGSGFPGAGTMYYDGIGTVLPQKVEDWLGWGSNRSGLYGVDGADLSEGGALTTDNDVRGLTFPQIAAIVRREWLEPAIAVQGVSAETK